MKFPFRPFFVIAHKDPADVVILLLRVIPPKDRVRDWEIQRRQEYFGSIWRDSFVVKSNINAHNPDYPFYTIRNPFIPIYSGKLIPKADGTEIRIKPGLSILGFLGVFILTCAWIAPLVVRISFPSIENSETLLHLAAFMWVLWLGLILCMMKTISDENTLMRDFLKRTVDAKPLNQSSTKADSLHHPPLM